ncbi:Uncharacterised protein [Candidatus Tiddalikarchaeum anstoanum]|nr:Uncharacterised protein [Candidatus Tiddalikarchaeum anstoanum]
MENLEEIAIKNSELIEQLIGLDTNKANEIMGKYAKSIIAAEEKGDSELIPIYAKMNAEVQEQISKYTQKTQ